MKTYLHCRSYRAKFSLERKIFQAKVLDKIKTHILCWADFSRKSCRLRDNVENLVQPYRPQMAIYHVICRMCFACWINKATDTHLSYVIVTAFPRQQWLRERASILRYRYTASLVLRTNCKKHILKPTTWIYSCYTAKWQAKSSLNVGYLSCSKHRHTSISLYYPS
jgi:hypothetical protein